MTAAMLVACGGSSDTPPPDAPPDTAPPPDAFVVPAFRNPLPSMSDADVATQSLQLLGASIPGSAGSSCGSCHGVTKQKLRYWRALSDTSIAGCLSDLSIPSREAALETIRCFRELGTDASDFATKKLGIYSIATNLPWFEALFRVAYGDEADAQLATFRAAAGMPKGGFTSFTQAQFDVIAEWFARGVPLLDESVTADPPPSTCESGVSSEVATHVAAMRTTGWKALNRAAMMPMHGCPAGAATIDCLGQYPLASSTAYGANWDNGNGAIRILGTHAYSSSFWTRSSPDGRFVGHGVVNIPGSYFYDLQRSAYVEVNAAYDPAFFPDNSGWVFQGGSARNTCPTSVLTSNPTSVTMNEAGCRGINNIGLYQHVGRGVGANADYFALDNNFVSDDGGKSPTLGDYPANFGNRSYSSFTAMTFDGQSYQVRGTVDVRTAFEGDTVLSHSGLLTVARVAGPEDEQIGFVLRKVNATPSGSSYTYELPEVARYCYAGGKPGFSFDERWIAYHHYVTAADAVELGFTGPSDPAFQPYLSQGAANIYLIELASGTRTRLTNMGPGQYALYPHFRADNWMYAQVRDLSGDVEYTIAHPAAVLLDP